MEVPELLGMGAVPLAEAEAQGEAEGERVGAREAAPLALAEGLAVKDSVKEEEEEARAEPDPVAVAQALKSAVGLLLRVRKALPVPQVLTADDWLGEALTAEEREAEPDAEGDWLPLGECEPLPQSVYTGVADEAAEKVALGVSDRGGVLLSVLEAVGDWEAEAQADAVELPCLPPRPPPLVGLGLPVPQPLRVALGDSELLSTALRVTQSVACGLVLCVVVVLLLDETQGEGDGVMESVELLEALLRPVAAAHREGGGEALRSTLAVGNARLAGAEGEEEGEPEKLCEPDDD